MKRYIRQSVSNLMDENYDIQQYVAGDPDTPVEYLTELVCNRNNHCKLSANPNTPPELLRTIAEVTPASNDGHSVQVFDNLVHNPSTPTDALEIVSHKCDWYSLYDLVKHPNTSRNTLRGICKSSKASSGCKKRARERLKLGGLK